MDERQIIKLTLKGENEDHIRAWEMLQSRDVEKYQTPTDYIVSAIIGFMGDAADKKREQAHAPQLPEAEFRKWEGILLDDMAKRFRIITRGPVGK